MFEFSPPHKKIAGITVCPSVGKLKPNEACRVEVTYKPDLVTIAVDGTDTSAPPPPPKKLETRDLPDDSSRPGSKNGKSRPNKKKKKSAGKKGGKKSSRPNSR